MPDRDGEANETVCTRVLWNDNDLAVLAGRTMDWPESTQPVLTVFPRGVTRAGGLAGSQTLVADNPYEWTSAYGSLVTTIYGLGTADGLNERGLGVHMLALGAADFGPRDARLPGLNAGLWAQLALDNAATVAEALALLGSVQIRPMQAHGHEANVHLALEDADGDSAIIEYLDGAPVVHHGREYRVMTNDPPFDQQLELLKEQDFSDPSRDMPLPGNVNPRDRFQRASYFLAMLPEPESVRQAVASVLSIARNVSVPFGAPYKGAGIESPFTIYNTEYRTAINLTGGQYFFELSTAPNVIWADLGSFDLAPGAPVMALDPDDIGLSGDVSDRFLALENAPF